MDNIFLVNPKLGSSYLMGTVLSKYSNGECISIKNTDTIKQLKNKNIILIKNPIGSIIYDPNLILFLKKNNNKIIYLVVDSFSVKQINFCNLLRQYSSLYDLVLFCSNHAKNQFTNLVNTGVLFHIWDPAFNYNKNSKSFNICYLGLDRADKIFSLNQFPVDHVPASRPGLYRDSIKYNCHFSIRLPGSSEFLYGVNTKLSTAAATNSNIICSQDKSFVELMPEYDYYVEDVTVEAVLEMIARCKTEFGTKKWFNNLEKLAHIREITAPGIIGKQLLNHINNL